MIKTFIKQLFTPKSRQAKSATADELSAAGSASGIAGTSREARKKLKARAKKPVLHKAHSYPAKKHGINPRHIPESARVVSETLSEAGFEAYVVGGAVRDLMLGHIPKDFDVATNARPEQVLKLFRRSRIIGRRFRIVHVLHKRDLIEVTTFRSDNLEDQETDEHGRVLRDNVYGNIESDASRRDMTINALYYDVKRQVVLDYHGGVSDLNDQVLRIIGEPETRFREDPVRMLRVLRFMAKFGFEAEAHTLDAMQANRGLLGHIPSARLFDETLKFFTTGHALRSFEVLQKYGFTEYLMPVLHDVVQNERGMDWVRSVLAQTDERVHEDKSISPGFLFAALMWLKVEERWLVHQVHNPVVVALDLAMGEVINQDKEQVTMTKRFVSDMRDIWSMQPRLERRLPRQIQRVLENPRFRAGYDFLLLRAQRGHLGEEGEEIAAWWGDMYAANGAERHRMIEALRQQPKKASTSTTGAAQADGADKPKKRRRRRKPKAKTADTTNGTAAVEHHSPSADEAS
jgi:poly(A) polymerase